MLFAPANKAKGLFYSELLYCTARLPTQDLSKYDINMKLIGIIVVVVFGLIAILSIIWLIEELVAIINSLLEMAVVLAALGLIGGVLAGLYFSLERRKGL